MMNEKAYEHIRSGGSAFHETSRGLIAVWGKEAVQFLDGLITNNVKVLEDGAQMLAAFPNAQGRLLAVIRVLRQGDRYLLETEDATCEKVFQNLFRFTFAGDFFVEDLSPNYRFIDVFNSQSGPAAAIRFEGRGFDTLAIPAADWEEECEHLVKNGHLEIDDELYETLHIESGVPKYGVDMDETTIVPELGLDSLISYNKGCYIGQEIIARIHFRGHVAKSLTGLLFGTDADPLLTNEHPTELTTIEGKNAGRITSITFSPKLGRIIALAYVRYEHLAEGTELRAGDHTVMVTPLPFI